MMNQQMSQKQLLQWINMVSFAVNDITLYLDMHPDDEEALNYLKHYKELRKQGLRAYADQYGPLTIDSAKVGDHWTGQPSLGRGKEACVKLCGIMKRDYNIR